MKTIDIKLTEAMLEPYGVTVEDLADVSGYVTTVNNPDYIPPQGDQTIPNPDYIPPVYATDENGETVYEDSEMMEPVVLTPAVGEPNIPNPDYVPAVGEKIIENPEKRTVFLAKKILEGGIQPIINKALARQRTVLELQLREVDKKEVQIVNELIKVAEINTIE